MKLLRLLLLLAIWAPAFAADAIVELPAVRVTPSDIALRARINTKDEIEEITVVAVVPGSAAGLLGIRIGDRLTLANGAPVGGSKRSTIYNSDGTFTLRGWVKFEGHRDGKKWSVIAGSHLLLEKKKGSVPDPGISVFIRPQEPTDSTNSSQAP